VALTRAAENVGENNDKCFETPFTQPGWPYLHVKLHANGRRWVRFAATFSKMRTYLS